MSTGNITKNFYYVDDNNQVNSSPSTNLLIPTIPPKEKIKKSILISIDTLTLGAIDLKVLKNNFFSCSRIKDVLRMESDVK
jgi:hypothetical protein